MPGIRHNIAAKTIGTFATLSMHRPGHTQRCWAFIIYMATIIFCLSELRMPKPACAYLYAQAGFDNRSSHMLNALDHFS